MEYSNIQKEKIEKIEEIEEILDRSKFTIWIKGCYVGEPYVVIVLSHDQYYQSLEEYNRFLDEFI